MKTETILRRRLAIESMKRAELIVTPSKSMWGMICNSCPELKEKKFYVLYHGFDKSGSQSSLDEKFSRLLERPGVRLLYPTHPAPHKGFEILFDILAKLKKTRNDFILYTTIEVADWPEVVIPYEARIRELGLEKNVVFTGRVPQSQMEALYRACDLMVYPSLCESFGFPLIEAMGYGLPIVAADTPINREICSEGAYYYSPIDTSDGVRVILEALQPARAEELKTRGRRRLDSFDWSWERYTREFVGILDTIAGGIHIA